MWKRDGHMSLLVGRSFKVVRPSDKIGDDFTVIDGLGGVVLVQSGSELNLVFAADVFSALHELAIEEVGAEKKRSLF